MPRAGRQQTAPTGSNTLSLHWRHDAFVRDAPAGPAQAVADTVLDHALPARGSTVTDDMAVLAVNIRPIDPILD